MSVAFGTAFTGYSSGSSSVSSFSLTVPAGVGSTDEIVIAFATINSTAITESPPTGITQELAQMEGTSSQLFAFVGSGHTAGDTLGFTLSTAERVAACGVTYPGGTFESIGAAGATSTNSANAPSVTTTAADDIAVAVFASVATSAANAALSGIGGGWNQRTSQSGGSGTRWIDLLIADATELTPGPTGALSATSGGTLLASTGVQLAIGSAGGGGAGGTAAKVNVAGTMTAATPKVNVAGTMTAATPKVNVAGTWT